jgi:glycogen debranching enzyme
MANVQRTAIGDAQGGVTIVEGSSFCLSDRAGDIAEHVAQGVFFRDMRIVSSWRLTLDDHPLEPLAVVADEPFACTFITRGAVRPGVHDTTLVVTRRRMIGSGLREDITVHNHGLEPAGCRLVLYADADFADLFDVKEGRFARRHDVSRSVADGAVQLAVHVAGQERGVRIRSGAALAVPGGLAFPVVVAPQGTWTGTVEVLPSTDGVEQEPPYPLGRPFEDARPSLRMAGRRASSPRIRTDHRPLGEALQQSLRDLGALRITDPERPGSDVVAAGAPWFMALFGRDALITSWLAMPFDAALAEGTLHTLARHQGRRVDPLSEEQPGRILHEVRLGLEAERAPGASHIYYGSVDATPLFVVLLDEAARWGLPRQQLEELLPAADRALEWITTYGDVDGDGFVEYRRQTDRGLANQGWKDSHDSIAFADGRLARAPIALCEVQGYVYAAYRARAHLAWLLDDGSTARRWDDAARDLRVRFDEAFWMEEAGTYALALDAAKDRVDSVASNAGHCLWSGIALPDRAARIAKHLTGPELFSGWGIRTLSDRMPTFNPVSYHNGSVWPHDTAMAVVGLARYGEWDAVNQVTSGLIDAADEFDAQLPELFCGFGRADVGLPVAYPASCSPQAWAAATPIGLLRALLGLRVCLPHGHVGAEPHLPDGWGGLSITAIRVGDTRVDVDTTREPAITGAPQSPGAPVPPCCE